MYLEQLKIWNFRKFGRDSEFELDKPNLDLHFQKGINILIGENDSGKTAIIDAIKIVLKTHSYEYVRFNLEDFHNETERIRIEIIFKELNNEEAKNFTEWLGWTKNGDSTELFLRLILDVKRKSEKILPFEVKAGADESGHTLDAEAREYLKCTYLKPLRDAENELIAKKNSRLSQILIGDEAFKGREDNHPLVELYNFYNTQLSKYFNGDTIIYIDNNNETKTINTTDGKNIKDKIDSFIRTFFDVNEESRFDTPANDVKAILEKITLLLKNERNPGLGTLNRLFMASELLHLSKSDWSGLRLGLIEELEAHLHPQAQLQVISTLKNLTDIQFILTTHSPNIASRVDLKSIIICHNSEAYSLTPSKTNLEEKDYEFLEIFLDTKKSDLFFAKGLIFVEGWAEEIIIPAIAAKMNINLVEKGVSVINVGSTAFLRYSKIFQRKQSSQMTIPVSIVRDLDIKPDEVKFYETREKKIEEFMKEFDGGPVKVFVSNFWTLEYCLLKSGLFGKKFKECVEKVHSGTDWSNFEEKLIEKLKNHSLDKVEIAYCLRNNLTNVDLNCIDNDAISYIMRAIKYASRC